jgi:predicted MFS family arabinose efflux permease
MTEREEKRIILVLAAVNFVNILDFMIVMPLGRDLAQGLDIPVSSTNFVVGAYMGAACLSGLAGAFFLDRFDRRTALAIAMLGLAVGTAGAALAQGFWSLFLARVVAGAFGGPATSLANAIIGDAIPIERRGRAIGTVMIAFSVSTVLGVPVGLELAHYGSWHTPFVATGALALIGAVAASKMLPPLRGHLDRRPEPARDGLRKLLSRGLTLLSYGASATSFMATFMVIPNIATFVQGNLHYPRSGLGLLYAVGGVTSLLTLRPIGRLVDRFGSFRVGSVGVVLAALVTWWAFIVADVRTPVIAIFPVFMLANGLRNVAAQTLSTRVPRPEERARFMSLQSVVQHGASFAGTIVAGWILSETASHELVHMDVLCWISIAMMAALPAMLRAVESRVRAETQPAAPARAA